MDVDQTAISKQTMFPTTSDRCSALTGTPSPQYTDLRKRQSIQYITQSGTGSVVYAVTNHPIPSSILHFHGCQRQPACRPTDKHDARQLLVLSHFGGRCKWLYVDTWDDTLTG